MKSTLQRTGKLRCFSKDCLSLTFTFHSPVGRMWVPKWKIGSHKDTVKISTSTWVTGFTSLNRRHHITAVPGFLPVCFRIDFQILLITFRACWDLAPHDAADVASPSEASLDPEDLWNSLPEKIQFAPICTDILCTMRFKLSFSFFYFIRSFYGFVNIVAELFPFILLHFLELFYWSSLVNCSLVFL